MTAPNDQPAVAVIGASRDRTKFGNKSVRAHLAQGYTVYAINPHAGVVEGQPTFARLSDVPAERLDRISVYVPPEVGIELLDEIAAHPEAEVWFNPGSESPALIERAEALGIEPIVACSIVGVGRSPAEFG